MLKRFILGGYISSYHLILKRQFLNKTINFELNDFSTTPHGLRDNPSKDYARTDFIVDLSRLYHHYYTDTYGVRPPNPNHANFEYLRFLDSCQDFRFLADRVSISGAHKRNLSYSLGQAFCRYFLYEFCGITYFAHMDKVLNKKTHPAFNGIQINRKTIGDVPYYLCAKSVSKPYIAEAKGRFSSISFHSAEFDDWRKQFERIEIVDNDGTTKRLKGFIVGTKFTTDSNRSTNKSKLFAEDPETTGKNNLSDNDTRVGTGCLAIHYSRLMSKLGLKLLSQSLEEGFNVSKELQYRLPVWQCKYPPLEGEKFVGGYISDVEPNFHELDNGHFIFYPNILKLGAPSPLFYGLRANTFRMLRKACLGNWNMLSEVNELPDTEFRPSNIAWLRDGSITGALDHLEYQLKISLIYFNIHVVIFW